MTTSYEIDEPLSEVELELLESVLSRKTYRVRPVITEHSTPTDMLAAAAQLCRDAFAKIDTDTIRATDSPAGDSAAGDSAAGDSAAGDGARLSDGHPLSRLSSVEELRSLEETIRAAAVTGSVVQGAAAIAMARYAAIDREVIDTDTGFAVPVERPIGHQADFADTDLAAACQFAPRTASTRLGAAVTACTKAPRLVEAAVAGGVPFWKVSLVAAELADATSTTAAMVEAELLGSRGFASWGFQKLKSTVRALVTRWEADAAKQSKQRTAREATGVWAEGSDIPGLSELRAVGPADQIAKIHAALDQLADTWRKHPEQHAEAHPEHYPQDPQQGSEQGSEPGSAFKPTVKPTLGQLRLDALCDLVTQGCDIGVHLVIHVPFQRQNNSDAHDSDSARPAAQSGRADGSTGGTGGTSDGARSTQAPATDGCDDDRPPTDTAGPPENNWTTDGSPGSDGWPGSEPSTGPPGSPAPPRPLGGAPDDQHDQHDQHDDGNAPSDGVGRGSAADWAEIPGIGLVAPDTVDALVERFGCRLTRVLFDTDTGITAETASARYEPPPKVREFVQLRDRSCRFPGCSRPAIRCDEDHVQEWPTGDTKGANLAAMCRHHHDAKTKGHWDVEMTDDGICTWISRTGRRYTTYPDSDSGRTEKNPPEPR
ncbi:HNH endonuclease signature motif containing protein [Calidifontibacter indicus]|uniref:HNH nuclease domain-containing protein n=2 Tax=Calidifontibacter indicus TaxID=419650 RepID=A0A3D9UUG9_9MICO|nr:HNH endonuclease signature motif containing protein [Calidifontibacter indicus]REF31600.1 hypothetical protein DFJ65_2671 [Calidifontibacter indicus]